MSGKVVWSSTIKAKDGVRFILRIEEEVLISSRGSIGFDEARICKSGVLVSGTIDRPLFGAQLTLLRAGLVPAIVLVWVYRAQADECDAFLECGVVVSRRNHLLSLETVCLQKRKISKSFAGPPAHRNGHF